MGRRPDAGQRAAALGGRVVRSVLIVAALVVASTAAAQEPAAAPINLDRLRLQSLGVGLGTIVPSQVEPATLFTFSADYGDIAPNWRARFDVSYWQSRYRDAVVQTFIDSLNANIVDPTGRTHLERSPISLYDVTLSAEARWVPTHSGELKPYIGFGLAAHVINAEGKLVNGTFVERALDNIATGAFFTGGVSVKLFKYFGIEGGARADLLSGFRSTQIRVGGAYYFGQIRGTRGGQPLYGGTSQNQP